MRSILLSCLILVACGKGEEPPPASWGRPNMEKESGPGADWGEVAKSPAKRDPKERAQAMFNTVCTMCHGADGRGNGGGAANLKVKPRDYTDAAWQASVTDAQIKEIIVKGGAGVGKNEGMPPQPQLANDPELLDALVGVIRGFKK
jgi:cytochrome c553